MEEVYGDRPPRCSTAYQVELAVREGNCWEGMIPCNIKDLTGWLRAMPFRKKQLENALHGVEDPAVEEAIRAQHEAVILEKAQHILNEATLGSNHEGADSFLRPDYRFKRTSNGNLYIGAGNILAAINEAAWFHTDNPGMKRRLKGKLWVSPGKVVMYRYADTGKREFVTKADGRNQRQIPPEPPSPANMFRGKPSTLVFAECVRAPAFVHFTLWTDPEVDDEDLLQWLTIAGELGLMKNRQHRQGQFDTVKFHRATEELRQELVRRERAKVGA